METYARNAKFFGKCKQSEKPTMLACFYLIILQLLLIVIGFYLLNAMTSLQQAKKTKIVYVLVTIAIQTLSTSFLINLFIS